MNRLTYMLLAALAVCALVTALSAQTPSQAAIHRVAVLGSANSLEVEILASAPLTPKARVLTDPDRLVLDFPNATPGRDLRNVPVNRGELRGVRFGLYSVDPPVTRMVLDLRSPLPYRVFTSGKMIIVKLTAATAEVAAVAPPAPVKPAPRVEVNFRNGELSIWADKATMAEVLTEVRRKTGAEVPIPSGSDQELVFANLGPGPARDVLSAFLNGSRFNIVMVGSERDPAQLRSLLLSPRGSRLVQTPVYTSPPQVTQPPSVNAPPPADSAGDVAPDPGEMPPDRSAEPPEESPQPPQ
jgi:hypothetical protein